MIKIYSCQAMTGRFCDEMRQEAEMLQHDFTKRGFILLNPVLEENVPDEHVLLSNVPDTVLERYWKRDKEMIRESDVVLDYKTQNKSDGSNKEVGYNRFCLWKPTVRVWTGPGALISKIEDDVVVGTLVEALNLIDEKWGTYEKLGKWRTEMWNRCYPRWLDYQRSLMVRYDMKETSC